MANPTSNFGWQMPTNTDLVKDLPADFETFGQAVDTSMADLKGGTTGQILSKNSNTDMDFVWIANDQGDITAVTAGTGLTGGGTAGAVTVSLDSPVAATLGGTAQTTYTTGDLLYASASNTLSKRAIGSSGQVLTVSGGVPVWSAPAGGGKVLQVVYGSTTTSTSISSTTTFSDTSLSASITPSATSSKVLVLVAQQATNSRNSNDMGFTYKLVRGSTDVFTQGSNPYYMAATAAPPNTTLMRNSIVALNYLDSPSTTSSTTYKTQGKSYLGTVTFQDSGAGGSSISTMILLEIGA